MASNDALAISYLNIELENFIFLTNNLAFSINNWSEWIYLYKNRFQKKLNTDSEPKKNRGLAKKSGLFALLCMQINNFTNSKVISKNK